MPVGHASAGGAAGSLVVVVDTESRLDNHVAVVVPVFAVFICRRREQKSLSTGAAGTTGKRKGGGWGSRSWSCCPCLWEE